MAKIIPVRNTRTNQMTHMQCNQFWIFFFLILGLPIVQGLSAKGFMCTMYTVEVQQSCISVLAKIGAKGRCCFWKVPASIQTCIEATTNAFDSVTRQLLTSFENPFFNVYGANYLQLVFWTLNFAKKILDFYKSSKSQNTGFL